MYFTSQQRTPTSRARREEHELADPRKRQFRSRLSNSSSAVLKKSRGIVLRPLLSAVQELHLRVS